MTSIYYYTLGAFVVASGAFCVCWYYRLEQRLYRAESKLREFTDGLPETQVSDEEWESLVERMR